MVLIVDGEILQDTDPRAIAARQRRAGGASSAGGGSGARPTPAPPRAGAAPPANDAPNNPLDQLAGAIGIQGQSLTVPAVWRVPAREVPLIWLVLLGVLTMFGGSAKLWTRGNARALSRNAHTTQPTPSLLAPNLNTPCAQAAGAWWPPLPSSMSSAG